MRGKEQLLLMNLELYDLKKQGKYANVTSFQSSQYC